MKKGSCASMPEQTEDYIGYSRLKFRRAGRVLHVSIDSPQTKNAVDDALHTELSRVFYDINRDQLTDVVVLSGTGKWFCAGGEMNWFQDMIDEKAKWRSMVVDAKRI